MTEQEKQLLFVALSGYYPYGIYIDHNGTPLKVHDFYNDGSVMLSDDDEAHFCSGETNKMYLRPMSSMTDEEDKEFALLQVDFYVDGWLYPIPAQAMVDWLNKHHFDYRGLIERGLALIAPEGLYNN